MPSFFTKKTFFLILVCLLLTPSAVFADADKQSQEISLYLPLSDKDSLLSSDLETFLSQQKLAKIKVKTIDHWHQFQQNIRHGKNGIYFVPPHFAAWAIHNHNFKPLVRIAEPLSYVITTQKNNSEIFELSDLQDKTICVDQPLNLNYLLINNAFHKRSISPKLVFTKPFEQIQDGNNLNCDAYSVSNHALDLKQNNFIRLYQSPNYNNYVLVSYPKVSNQTLQKLQNLFVSKVTIDLLKPMLQKFAANPVLIKAQIRDYPVHYAFLLKPYW